VGAGVFAYAVSWWFLLAAAAGPVVGAGLAHDRWRGLGHALVDGHLVARSGSLDRRREILQTRSVIGWNLRATWFQRRAGLTDLTATTAGGRQRIRILDLDESSAPALAAAATPGLVEQFLA
jgi:putative membrane protein